MKNNLIKISAIVLSFAFVIIPSVVTAAAVIENPLKITGSISGFISTVLGYIVKIGGVVAIFAFIYSGFLFVKAQGNPTGLEDAKRVFINTCIGVAILLGAQLISSIIVGTLKSLS